MAHVLMVGLGELGRPVAERIAAAGHEVSALCRRPRRVDGVQVLAQELGPDAVTLPDARVDLVMVILAPGERSDAAYERTYVTVPGWVMDALGDRQSLPPVLYVSSTAVYGDQDGVVDEFTVPCPSAFNGRRVLEGELALAARTQTVSVRLSGLYGSGSRWMLGQAQAVAEQGQWPPCQYTNRIHRQDAADLVADLGLRLLRGEAVPNLVVGTDTDGATNHDLLAFLLEGMGRDVPRPQASPGGKRVRSRYLERQDFVWSYPDYRAGYGALLQEWSEGSS